MRVIDQYIGRQIRKPSGLPGWWLGRAMGNEHKPLVSWMLDSVVVRPTDHVLDVGCGGGMTLKVLAEQVRDGHVAGIDLSRLMVRQARRLNGAEIARGRVSVVRGTVEALPFADARFDLACAVESLYFWSDPLRGLREIARVLKPGGRVAVAMDISKESSTPHVAEEISERMGFRVYSGEEVQAALRDTGFVEATFKAKPDVGKGWLSAYGVKPTYSHH
jgi:ubiquinone/menaquinone biosynthesis C-methylase UbiE